MLSEVLPVYLYGVIYRLLFGVVIVSLSSVCLGIHFYLDNSFSIIQEWFEVYFIEIIALSSIIVLFGRKYMSSGYEKKNKSYAQRSSDSLLLVNYFVIVFFTMVYLKPEVSFELVRHSLFFSAFILVDFVNSEGGLTDRIISTRGRFLYWLLQIALSFLMFFIFFEFKYRFSYLYLIFLTGFFISKELLQWRVSKVLRFYAPLVVYFGLCLKSNLLFPLNEKRVLYFIILFFVFNLITFIWHRFYFKKTEG